MLPLTTLVHNNTQNSTTGLAPNQLLNGLEPTITPNQRTNSDNLTAELRVDQLRQQRKQATAALNEAANSKSPTTNIFKYGQKVWLKAKNLALPYGSVKLAPRQHGPFPIAQVISPVTYKLTLPTNGLSTLCFMRHFLPHIAKQKNTEKITPGPHLTSWGM